MLMVVAGSVDFLMKKRKKEVCRRTVKFLYLLCLVRNAWAGTASAWQGDLGSTRYSITWSARSPSRAGYRGRYPSLGALGIHTCGSLHFARAPQARFRESMLRETFKFFTSNYPLRNLFKDGEGSRS